MATKQLNSQFHCDVNDMCLTIQSMPDITESVMILERSGWMNTLSKCIEKVSRSLSTVIDESKRTGNTETLNCKFVVSGSVVLNASDLLFWTKIYMNDLHTMMANEVLNRPPSDQGKINMKSRIERVNEKWKEFVLCHKSVCPKTEILVQ